jgi:predicted Zn-dependent protease
MEIIDNCIVTDSTSESLLTAEEDSINHHSIALSRAWISTIQRDYTSAVYQYELALKLAKESPSLLQNDIPLYCQVLAEFGKTVEAHSLLHRYSDLLTLSGSDSTLYWFSRGAIRLSEGDPEGAALDLDAAGRVIPSFPVKYLLARALIETEHLDSAIVILENLARSYTDEQFIWGTWRVKTHYWLGVAYQEAGMIRAAMEQYRVFLGIWKDADAGLVEVDDARRRLAREDS